MQVTRFGYPLEAKLIHKLDLMIARVTQKNPKRDAVLLNEGSESEGKTTISIAEAYYISEKANMPFNVDHVFFDLQKMMDFLKSTDKQIAIWDEPALYALTGDANKKILKDLVRLLMMCRKKRHFVIINMTYFNKFNDYIVWQRPLGMVHVYSRDEKIAGRFIYIRKKKLELLWRDWQTKKRRNYKKYGSSIRGTFPDVLNPDYKHNVLSEFDVDTYENNKDKAIQSVGVEEKKIEKPRILRLRYNISLLPQKLKITGKQLAEYLQIDPASLTEWREIAQKYPYCLEK